MILRPYQNELIGAADAALDEHHSIIVALATGGGKTPVMSSMAKSVVEQGGSVWALAHREELVDQMSEKFAEFGVPHGIVKSGYSIQAKGTQVGMIQTIRNKLHLLETPDYIFIDECHHTPASQYADIINATKARRVGFTATPWRLDGKGLGDFYNYIVPGPQTAELISMGFLCPPRIWAPALIDTKGLHTKYGDYDKREIAPLLDEPAITGDVIKHYEQIASGTSAAVFCVDIEHASHVAEGFNAAGISASYVSGAMPKTTRRNILARFRAKEILVLTTADLISEGFDCPGIETVILLRPTKSLTLYMQQVGRGLRLADGKLFARLIDHVQNTVLHGSPTRYRYWDLEGRKKNREKDEDEIDIRVCSVCHLAYEGAMCGDCGVLEKEVRKAKEKRKIKERDGELTELIELREYLTKAEALAISSGLWSSKNEVEQFAVEQGVTFKAVRDALLREAKDYEQLSRVGKMLGYKPEWVDHRYNTSVRFQ